MTKIHTRQLQQYTQEYNNTHGQPTTITHKTTTIHTANQQQLHIRLQQYTRPTNNNYTQDYNNTHGQPTTITHKTTTIHTTNQQQLHTRQLKTSNNTQETN